MDSSNSKLDLFKVIIDQETTKPNEKIKCVVQEEDEENKLKEVSFDFVFPSSMPESNKKVLEIRTWAKEQHKKFLELKVDGTTGIASFDELYKTLCFSEDSEPGIEDFFLVGSIKFTIVDFEMDDLLAISILKSKTLGLTLSTFVQRHLFGNALNNIQVDIDEAKNV